LFCAINVPVANAMVTINARTLRFIISAPANAIVARLRESLRYVQPQITTALEHPTGRKVSGRLRCTVYLAALMRIPTMSNSIPI
jgi:hypothetical protein